MTFAWPHLFWLLLLPVALLAYEFARRRRAAATDHPKILQAEAGTHDLSLVPHAAPPRRPRPWLAVGLVLVIAALARPQWGRLEEPVFDQAREILIALDLSRSMLSQDVKPSRLARAKLLVQSLLEKLAGERVGLVTFSGTAFLQSPLSSDYEILREFLPALDPGFLPEGGTNYGAMIETALAAFGHTGAADRYLIVLSDGEATEPDWRSAADELRKKGIRVIALGVGTPGGAMIPDGAGGFVKDERGAVVLSKLESSTLEELAQVTGGTYRDASTWVDLAGVLSATVDAGQKGKFLEKTSVRLVERFQWPLGLGLWCLCVSFCFEFPVRPRPREIRLRGKPAGIPTAAAAAALLLLLAVRLPAAPEPAAPAPPPLAKIVSRLSSQDTRTARDWAEMALETVTWGQHLQSESRPVPPGPVRDALAAVDLGAGLDAKTADWPKLQEQLQALLRPPPEQKPQDQPQNQPPDQKNQQDQQDSSQQKQQPQKQPSQPKPEAGKQNQPQDQSKSESSPQNSPPPKPDPGKKADSAFGDMKEPAPPPRDTQKVGGVKEQKDQAAPPSDPSLALPLQKLDQLRNQDSPAELYQLMDTDKKSPPKKKGKDW